MGRKADFHQTIVLLTSNLGARFLAGQSTPLGFAAGSEAVFEKQSAQAIEEAKSGSGQSWLRPSGRDDRIPSAGRRQPVRHCRKKMLCQLEQRAARSGYQLHHTPRVGQALAAKAALCLRGQRTAPRSGQGSGAGTLRIRSHPARPAWARTGQRTARRMVLSSCGRTKPQHCKSI